MDHPPVTEEEEHKKSGSIWNPSEDYEEMVVIEIFVIEIFVQENIQVTASFCFYDYLGFSYFRSK